MVCGVDAVMLQIGNIEELNGKYQRYLLLSAMEYIVVQPIKHTIFGIKGAKCSWRVKFILN